MKYLSVGDRVLVHIPAEYREYHKPIAPYHGTQGVISRRKVFKHSGYVYYELDGVKSDHWNIPFAFVGDWLNKLDGEEVGEDTEAVYVRGM